jgi:hypothetical protein
MKKFTARPSWQSTRDTKHVGPSNVAIDCTRSVVADLTHQLLPVCVEVSFAFKYQR